eukprot:CAMPEP_0178417690 /NCGR_PEP_ID=MMETSP0689_2-20121128/24701_1 /TAXON_ID=160604 /ORGANISM="Amphidinium massartii, Strain CS-259" /LENGTH=173 /DNA_ID=CAMNT_0020039057 /DNA_START=546 /DNA_END=1068 /DNA_ORIENTATION=-
MSPMSWSGRSRSTWGCSPISISRAYEKGIANNDQLRRSSARILCQSLVQGIAKPEGQATKAYHNDGAAEHDVLLCAVANHELALLSLLLVMLLRAIATKLTNAYLTTDEGDDGEDSEEEVAATETARQLAIRVDRPIIAASRYAEMMNNVVIAVHISPESFELRLPPSRLAMK